MGTTYFTIGSNATWEISEVESWLHITPVNGIGNATVTVNYDANTGPPRQGMIHVNVAGIPSQPVLVEQESPFVLVINPDSLIVGPSSGHAPLSVTSNINWTAASNATWLQVYPVNGSHNEILTLTFNANTSDSVRIASITLTSAELPPVTSYFFQQPGQGTERILLPNLIAGTNATIQLPVNVSDITGYGILSCDFTFVFDTTVLVPATPYIVTSGSLMENAGWGIMNNHTIPGQLSVGAIGTEPLSGMGTLIKLVFKAVGGQGTSSVLSFNEFIFNDNNPLVEVTNGLLTVPVRSCGDADENGFVQAYDASLTLKHSIGLVTLSPQGAYNADVNGDNIIKSFDAALILREAIWLPMPSGTSTCFNPGRITSGTLPTDFQFYAILSNIEKQEDGIIADILFSGIIHPEQVFSVSFDLVSLAPNLNSIDFIDLPAGYTFFTNQISNRVVRMALIHPMGVLTQDLRVRIALDNCEALSLALSGIMLNDHEFPDIPLSGSFISPSGQREAMLTAYPNPFTTIVTIAYEVMMMSYVEIEITDLYGRNIYMLFQGIKEEGFYKHTWDGQNQAGGKLPQGWYIIRLTAENYTRQSRVCLIY